MTDDEFRPAPFPSRSQGVPARDDSTSLLPPQPIVSRPHVTIIDDHAVLGLALAEVFEHRGLPTRYVPARGEVEDLSTLVGQAPEGGGIAVVDLHLGDGPAGRRWGVDLVAPLGAAGWRVVIVSGRSDTDHVERATALGATVVAPWPASVDDLVARVLGGPIVVLPDPAARSRPVDDALSALTARERQILTRLAEGQRAKAIAAEFVTSVSTVRSQIRSILRKLDVSSQLEAVALVRGTRQGAHI